MRSGGVERLLGRRIDGTEISRELSVKRTIQVVVSTLSELEARTREEETRWIKTGHGVTSIRHGKSQRARRAIHIRVFSARIFVLHILVSAHTSCLYILFNMSFY